MQRQNTKRIERIRVRFVTRRGHTGKRYKIIAILHREEILKWFPARKEAIPFAKIVSFVYRKNSFTEDILRKLPTRRVTSPRQNLHPDKTYPGISSYNDIERESSRHNSENSSSLSDPSDDSLNLIKTADTQHASEYFLIINKRAS